MPTSSPPCTSRRSSGGSSSIVSRSFSSAGLPASSPITWPSPAVMVSSDRAASRPATPSGAPRRRPTHPDGAVADDLLADEQHGLVVGGPAGGQAAEQWQHRRGLGQEAQHRVGREGHRVGEQDRAVGAGQVGHAGQRAGAFLELLDRRVERVALPSPRLAANTDTAEPPSISRPWPITPPAPQPIRPPARGPRAPPRAPPPTPTGCFRDEDDRELARRAAQSPPPPAASSAAVRPSGTVERPVPMRTPMRLADDTAPPLPGGAGRARRRGGRRGRGYKRDRRLRLRRGRGPRQPRDAAPHRRACRPRPGVRARGCQVGKRAENRGKPQKRVKIPSDTSDGMFARRDHTGSPCRRRPSSSPCSAPPAWGRRRSRSRSPSACASGGRTRSRCRRTRCRSMTGCRS